MWTKLKEIFSNFASIVISAILIIAIIAAGIVIAKNNDDKKEETNNNPEVAQVFEPSISTPLPADINEGATTEDSKTDSTENTGEVAGDSTTEQSTSPTTNFIAPQSGVNPNAEIRYQSSNYGFSITVPAHTNISEQNNLVNFANLFYVSIVDSKENLEQISNELSQSNEVKNIQTTTLSGSQALKFSMNNSTGYVVIRNNKAFYLIGQDKYISQVKI